MTYAYSYIGQRPLIPFNMAPIFLRILLISSLWKVEAYFASFTSVTSKVVTQFLDEYLEIKGRETDYRDRPLVMIMDNGPKNRSAAVKNLQILEEYQFYTLFHVLHF